MSARSAAYWRRRSEEGMLYVQRQADRRLATIGKAASQAQAYLSDEARKIFKTFAGRFDLTEEQAKAELNKPITRAEYDSLLERIATLPDGPARTALEIRANSGAYAYRISRAEALRENIAVETARFAQVEHNLLTEQLRETAVESYAHRMFTLQSQSGQGFAVPDIHAMRVAIDTPWAGQSYSQRIWGDRDSLAGALEEAITSGYLSGKSHAKVARDIRDRFGVGYRDAERLVRTETSHVSNQADKVAYEDAEIDKYTYDSALDSKTCPVCGELDMQHFPVSEAQTGINFPPMHPHCRCTTVARLEDAPIGQRLGKDASGKNVLLPGDISYEEWKQWQEAGAPEDVGAWRASQDQKTLNSQGDYDTIREARSSPYGPTRYPVTQAQIDEIVQKDLKNYAFPVQPMYSPRIKDNGVTRFREYPSGRTEVTAIVIGKQDSPARDFLVDTVLHEWLEAEIVQKQWSEPFYNKLHKMTDKDRHKWIYAEIKKYFDRRSGKP